jgi:hypothetical protein
MSIARFPPPPPFYRLYGSTAANPPPPPPPPPPADAIITKFGAPFSVPLRIRAKYQTIPAYLFKFTRMYFIFTLQIAPPPNVLPPGVPKLYEGDCSSSSMSASTSRP